MTGSADRRQRDARPISASPRATRGTDSQLMHSGNNNLWHPVSAALLHVRTHARDLQNTLSQRVGDEWHVAQFELEPVRFAAGVH